MGRLFGTDGVRGLANGELTAELALDLSVAAAHVLGEVGAFEGHRPRAVVGRDPRASGEFLEAAVVAGLAGAGIDVIRLGVIPTPAVAHLTDAMGVDVGVMLSASHNPMPDNGVKFFSRGGHKLDDALEDLIEARIREPWQRPTGAGVGRVTDDRDGFDAYVAHLVRSVPNRFDGLRVVVDCANGAAYRTAPETLGRLGATVIPIHAEPDGLNINDGCGSTHPESLVAAVAEHGADVGIAHDGDADRCLAVDRFGNIVDGDQILAILALSLREAGRLASDTVVATVLSNLGFSQAMQREGIAVEQTKVGDRYVLEAMKTGKFNLGGEQSGHIVLLDHATTGDGVLAAAHLLARMAATGRPLDELAAVMTRLPQVMVNVRGVDRTRADTDPDVAAAVTAAGAELGETGRVVLRPSGTEPVVRVMVEAPTCEHAQQVADQLARTVQRALAL
ncbi:phosphoglucosamine mutase [Actinopolymorpha singaporensis]|uniref:Phosphoglucosamine mutase n=1 Tax=Actinopolymorpha singaporensis TaxID=117157 RepID=A0A1H1SE28_9ACTN|nr:phosphoglucosamine mutase [Actinopolymorpha singaporensis]SDS46360.1 phosphoglucosamine mutase [Actinopolymorpha singaporensis]